MSQDQKETKKNSGRGFWSKLIKWKTWKDKAKAWKDKAKAWITKYEGWVSGVQWKSAIDKKKIWLIIAIIAALTLCYVFPFVLGIIEVCLILSVLYKSFPNLFTRKNLSELFTIDNFTSPIGDLISSIDQLIRILVALGLILLIHFLFGDHSFLTFIIDYAFEQLSLDDRKGNVVGSILGFTAILWGLNLTNKRLDAFHQQIDISNKRLDAFREQIEISNRQLDAFHQQIDISNRQLDASYKHNLEDRFIRSVDLTGKKDLAIRLGGLAGLQALTHENAKMYTRVWEYLASFLRNPPDLEGWETVPKVMKIGYSGFKKEILVCWRILNQKTSSTQDNRERMIGERPDIVHIAQILREQNEQQRKWKKEENFSLPLSEIHLAGANLREAHLERADLSSAHLERADLSSARLEGAKLWSARLEGAKLLHARLEGARLWSARLEGANLSSARLEGARLWHARLEGADLSSARLEGAKLWSARLEGADLRDARLEGAKLWSARLEGADLRDAQLDSTDLTATDLSKVKNLTPQQFIGKKCRYRKDNPPLLPEEWSQEQREQVLASMEAYEV